MIAVRAAVAAACGLLCFAGAAPAQDAASPGLRPGRVVVSAGGSWIGAENLGGRDATIRQSALGTTTPPPFTLFEVDSNLEGAPMAEVALTVGITRAWALEVRGAAGHRTLTTSITGDVEAAGAFTASERVSEYVVDASAVYHLGRPRIGRRARLFVLAGGGYLRQLHERDVLVETGRTWHGGAGARLWLRGGDGRHRDVGFTGEVRWIWRMDGVAFDGDVRSAPAASLRLFVLL